MLNRVVFSRRNIIKLAGFTLGAWMYTGCRRTGNPGFNGNPEDNLVKLEGAYNFRDLGGYRGAGGLYVKRGLVYRADELGNLTDNDLAVLSGLGIVTDVDFRSRDEVNRLADRLPDSVKNTYHLAIEAGNLSDSSLIQENPQKFMEDMNRSLAAEAHSQYREFFQILSDASQLPLVFHCTAGKDRTGFGAALFLASLGVSEEDIYDNYLLSAKYVAKKYESLISTYPGLADVFTVKKSYLEAAINDIKENYGSVENYLVQVLNVDLERMRNIYLEPV